MIWKGVPLGFDSKGRPIACGGNLPTLIMGAMGSNKTVGHVALQLLDDDSGNRSYIVLDPKGEVCALTCKYRRKVCGKDNVKIINPYGLLAKERPDMKSDGWNPLAHLNPDAPSYGDDCAALGDALIKTSSNESQPIFPNSARSAFTAGINFEVREARRQNLPPSLANVRAMLTLETAQLVEVIKKMIATGDPDIVTRMRKFLNDNREIQSIKSNIETDSAWMTKPMRDDMMCGKNGVDFSACKKRPATIYIILPTEELKPAYLRLVVSSALRALYRHGGVPTTVIVEEAFALGYLEELEKANSILRGFGSRVTFVYQSIQQIKKLYPDTWGLFTGGTVLAFRPVDLETAKWMSERAGEVIVPVLSAADPSSPNDFGVRPSWQQQKRPRIPLSKMFGMPQGRALVWLPNEEVPRVSQVKGYFEIRKLRRRASPNPYYTGGSASAGGNAVKTFAAVAALAAAAIAGFIMAMQPNSFGVHARAPVLPPFVTAWFHK